MLNKNLTFIDKTILSQNIGSINAINAPWPIAMCSARKASRSAVCRLIVGKIENAVVRQRAVPTAQFVRGAQSPRPPALPNYPTSHDACGSRVPTNPQSKLIQVKIPEPPILTISLVFLPRIQNPQPSQPVTVTY